MKLSAVCAVLMALATPGACKLRNRQADENEDSSSNVFAGEAEQQLVSSPLDITPPIRDNSGNAGDDPLVRVNIGINRIKEEDVDGNPVSNDEQGRIISQMLAELSPEAIVHGVHPSISGGTITVRKSEIDILNSADGVMYVEEDGPVYEHNVYAFGETISLSIDISNGSTDLKFPYPRGTTHECSDYDATKIAIVDGGMDTGHWDFEFCGINPVDGSPIPGKLIRCMGQQFLSQDAANAGQNWFNSARSHGSHVAGLVGASGLNGKGVAGMLPDEDFCLVIVRIFDDTGGASISSVVSGVTWAADLGVNVINMSFGTDSDSASLKAVMDYATSKGALIVASAGNSNTNLPNYPAAYSGVLGVGAVDVNLQKAWFSNYGSTNAKIWAVGTDVMSTVPRANQSPLTIIQNVALDQQGSLNFQGNLMIYSQYIGKIGVSGKLANCDFSYLGCQGMNGKVCLIDMRRGGSFYTMAENCRQNNGTAAIIYNDADVPLLGTMGVSSQSQPQFESIPVVGVSRSIGLALKNYTGTEFILSNPVQVGSDLAAGYQLKTGTSMAAPQVAGAAAYLTRQCPRCSLQTVTDCLISTSLYYGTNTLYGSGALQTDRAFRCIVYKSCCPFGRAILTRSLANTPASFPIAKRR